MNELLTYRVISRNRGMGPHATTTHSWMTFDDACDLIAHKLSEAHHSDRTEHAIECQNGGIMLWGQASINKVRELYKAKNRRYISVADTFKW